MGSNKEKKSMRGLILICVGLFGIIFSLVFPPSSELPLFTVSIVLNMCLIIGGVIILLLGLAGKLPTPQPVPPLIALFLFSGTLFLILSVLMPLSFSVYFVLGIQNYAVVGYYLWLYLKERQTKSS